MKISTRSPTFHSSWYDRKETYLLLNTKCGVGDIICPPETIQEHLLPTDSRNGKRVWFSGSEIGQGHKFGGGSEGVLSARLIERQWWLQVIPIPGQSLSALCCTPSFIPTAWSPLLPRYRPRPRPVRLCALPLRSRPAGVNPVPRQQVPHGRSQEPCLALPLSIKQTSVFRRKTVSNSMSN